MSKVITAHAVSVDGYITGRDPGPGRGLGAGTMLFDWYFDGDTPSQVFDGFRLSGPSARIFDDLAGRVGAVAAAREAAGGKDVGLMGGGVATEALTAGLVDEVILHQVPILLGGGRPFFRSLPEHVRLRLVEAVPAPGVTHLHYEVERLTDHDSR
jgi:hypothetical protein